MLKVLRIEIVQYTTIQSTIKYLLLSMRLILEARLVKAGDSK